MTIRSRVRTLPKAELHLHLEGAVPLTALWELLSKYGLPPGMGGIEDLTWKNGYLREYDDLVRVNLVADLVRDFGPERGLRWLREIDEVRHLGVVGIGIGGSEHAFPPEPYAAVYREARERGFRTSAHAGEGSGPESVWGAVRALEVDRIGHGTRAVEDPELVALLVERRIPIEACPISNVRTGVVPAVSAHPIRALFDAGAVVTVNTDDPKMFNTSLEDEYAALAEHLGFTWEEILTLNANAVSAAWCGASYLAGGGNTFTTR